MGCLASSQHPRQLLAHLPSISARSRLPTPTAPGPFQTGPADRPAGPHPTSSSNGPGDPSDIHGPIQGHCSTQPSLEGLQPTAPLLNTHTRMLTMSGRIPGRGHLPALWSPTICWPGGGRAREDGGGGERMPECKAEARAPAAARAGAHLFDLVIFQLGEVIGQELRGDHAGGLGRGAAGVRPMGPPQPG